MFDGLEPRDRDPRAALHLEEVPVPELGLGEALIAVMASSVNYNTVLERDLLARLDLRLPAPATAGCPRWPRGTTCPTT